MRCGTVGSLPSNTAGNSRFVRRTDMSDRQLLSEFIALYKEFPCLWDSKKIIYSNKEARDQAYEVLVEKYKQIQEDATLQDVKKKIENLRAGFRREHKKVLLSRLNGDKAKYEPQLWYYPDMVFLDDVINICKTDGSEDDIFKHQTPKAKIPKMSPIYLRDRIDSDEEVDDNDGEMDRTDDAMEQLMQHHIIDPITTGQSMVTSEAEAFGTTVGLQLKEVHPTQRAIAEKLISDIIFNARFNRLTMNTIIVVHNQIKDLIT